MSDRPDVQTSRSVIRTQLAQAFPGNTRLQRVFESIIGDVSETLPDAIADAVDAAADASASAQAAAATALALATQAISQGDGPPTMPIALAVDDSPPILESILARLATLERAVANLREGPTP